MYCLDSFPRSARPIPRITSLGAALAATLAVGCGDGVVAPSDETASGAPTTMTTVSADARVLMASTSGFTEPAQLVLTTPEAWTAAWSTVHARRDGGAAPSVNFGSQVVVLVAMGQRNTGGHAVRIDGTGPAADGALVVHVTRTSPGPRCMTTQEITSPVDVVRLARPAGAVRFQVTDVVTDC